MGKRKTILLVIASIVVLAVMGGLLALWNPAPPPPVTPMPVPNGYEAFVQGGTLVQNQTFDFATMNEVELHYLVDANSNALQTARAGFAEKSRVPVGFSQQYVNNHIQELAQMKRIAQGFVAEGQLAEMEQRTNDAAQSYLDAARFGIKSRRGGPLIDSLVGFAEEAMGTYQLQKLVPNLDAKTSAELARQLEAADAERESWEQILQNERYWVRGLHPGLQHRITELFTWAELKASKTKAKQRYDAQQNKTCRLMLDLAARAYQLDKGHRPTNVADLVPDYLKAAPMDPLTGKEMTLTP